jgi:hypothetical protein
MTEVKAQADPEGAIIVEANTKLSEHTFMLNKREARRLLIDLIHATDMEVPENE